MSSSVLYFVFLSGSKLLLTVGLLIVTGTRQTYVQAFDHNSILHASLYHMIYIIYGSLIFTDTFFLFFF